VYHARVPLRRELGAFDATMAVVGGIIGSGIFLNPALVARTLDRPSSVLLAWTIGGAVALVGAFAYAELADRLPRAGGPYAYLREAWHPAVGFLYGWALLLLIETGAIAAVAITFATYALRLAGAADVSPRPLAIAAIVVLSVINCLGVKLGSRVLNVLVVLKVAALVGLIASAWFIAASPGWLTVPRPDVPASGLADFGTALIPILFAYGGWQSATTLAEEMRNPARDLPRSIVLGTVIVIAVYLLVNVAYMRTLGIAGLAASTSPASDSLARWLGTAGERAVAGAIAISTFGFLNLSVLAPTRIYYAIANDTGGVPGLGRLHARYQTPVVAILVQSAWAILLAITGEYGDLLDTVVFADWIFFGLTVAGLFRLRARSSAATGFRMPGYPWAPALFVGIAIVTVYSTVRAAPGRSAVGMALILLGLPVYAWLTRRRA
jgi:APA family basic amino acid/polyamine antiporter